MNYSREPDELMHKYAHKQAYLFAQSTDDHLPSYFFIKLFMHGYHTKRFDKLENVSDDELVFTTYFLISKNRGKIFDKNVMHWIGYIYRVIAYIYDIPSSHIFNKVPPKYMVKVYPLFHSLDPVKAASKIYEDKIKEKESKEERLMNLMRKVYL